MLRCSPLAVLLALSGCAATDQEALGPADDRASEPFLYSSNFDAYDARRCVMQAIAERYGALRASTKDDWATEHHEIRLSIRGRVAALVEIDPENVGARVLIWIPERDRSRESMAKRLIWAC